MTSRFSSLVVPAAFAVVSVVSTACTVERVPPPAPPPPPISAAPPPPPVVGAHPAYIHALQELRFARANLARKGGDAVQRWDERNAIAVIDRAIADCQEAAMNDGKSLDNYPPVDDHEPRSGRLHKAFASLETARREVGQEEDNRDSRGLRNRALRDIDEAINLTRAGMQDM